MDISIPSCPAPFQKLLSDEVFRRYPANVPARRLEPVAPLVRTGEAHLYRTTIREQAKQGANFAGHYTLIRIGCGAATVCPAIVDSRTGMVFFPRALRSATALLMDTGTTNVRPLNYKRDSRLLIVVGSPNEDMKKDGMIYYVWRADKLTPIRFVPASKVCAQR